MRLMQFLYRFALACVCLCFSDRAPNALPATFDRLSGTPNMRCNVNKAARNMVENAANTARNQGIYVHSAALGAAVNNPETSFSGGCSTNSEVGVTILKRVANTTDSTHYNAAQPTGIYVSAATIAQCDDAFSKVASEILPLTK